MNPRVLRRWLLAAVAVVAGLGLAIELVHTRSHADTVELLVAKLSLSYEGNVPTWFTSSVLLLCAIGACAIARRQSAWRAHWWGIGLVAGWMSLDEAIELHEHLGGLFGTGGVLYFDWVIPAGIFVIAVGLVYLPFVRALAELTRRRLVIAAAIYIGGALVMELPLGWWTEQHGTDGFGYALIDWFEETMEMIGASLALVALVAHREESA